MTAKVSAAPCPILLEIPDEPDRTREFRMSPLSDKDTDELDNWVQYKLVEMARKSLDPEATAEDRNETLRIAMTQAASLSWTNGAGAATLDTAAGRARLLWQSLKKLQPELTEADLRPYMRYQANVERLLENWKQLNGMKTANPPSSTQEATTATAS